MYAAICICWTLSCDDYLFRLEAVSRLLTITKELQEWRCQVQRTTPLRSRNALQV